MPDCVHCGGSGVLNIEMTNIDGVWDADRRVVSCHVCEVGLMWFELDLDVWSAT